MNNQRGDCGVCVIVMVAMMAGAFFMWGHGRHGGMGGGHHAAAQAPEAVAEADATATEEKARPLPSAARRF